MLDALRQHYVSNFSGDADGPGISIYTCICLTPKTTQSVEYLLDIGHSVTRNRITLTRSGDSLVTFSVVDNAGLRSSQDINIADHCDGAQFICGVHVTHTSTSALVLFEVNGNYVGEHRLAKGGLALMHPLPIAVGTDMEGQHFACMILGNTLTRDPALTVVEREQLRKYLFDTLGLRTSGMERSSARGDLCVQRAIHSWMPTIPQRPTSFNASTKRGQLWCFGPLWVDLKRLPMCPNLSIPNVKSTRSIRLIGGPFNRF